METLIAKGFKNSLILGILVAFVASGCSASFHRSVSATDKSVSTTTKLVWGGAGSINDSACVSYTIQNETSGGQLSNVPAATLINLSGGGSGTFYTNSTCMVSETAVTLPINTSFITIFFSSSTPGSLDLTASAEGLITGTLSVTVQSSGVNSITASERHSELSENQLVYGSANSIAADFSGALYAVGSSTDESGSNHWVVRKSLDGIWSTIDDFQYASAESSVPNSIAIDDSENIYVAGHAYDSTNADHWMVRKYSNGSWNTIDDFTSHGLVDIAHSITTDQSGNVYVAGESLDEFGLNHWIVRRYSNGIWATIDDFQYDPSAHYECNYSIASAVVSDLSGNVYAAGTGCDSSGNRHWIVRKYSNGNWSTVDDYTGVTGRWGQAQALSFDSSGNLYAAGTAYNNSSGYDWIVRKYSGGSWSVFDDYAYSSEASQANALTADSSGNIYAVGYGFDSSGYQHWLVREYTHGSWKIVQDYQASSGRNSQATAVISTPADEVVSCGSGVDSSGNQDWITLSSQ